MWQPAEGFRFAVDSLLVVALAGEGPPARHAFDLGAGCGVVGLALLAALPERPPVAARVTGVEIDPGMADLARRAAREAGWDDRLDVDVADLREAEARYPRGCADLVVANPPHHDAARGTSPGARRTRARHDATCRPADLARAAAWLLTPGGRACVVYPWTRATEVASAFGAAGLPVARTVRVHTRADRAARFALLEVRPGPPQARAAARDEALVLHDGAPGTSGRRPYAPAVERFLRTGASPWRPRGA